MLRVCLAIASLTQHLLITAYPESIFEDCRRQFELCGADDCQEDDAALLHYGTR